MTSNEGFAEWWEMLGDTVIATNHPWDCLLHHSHVVNLRGDSYRLREEQRRPAAAG